MDERKVQRINELTRISREDIPTTGITQITKEKIEEARANNCTIKLIAHAKKLENGEVEYEVKPMNMDNSHPLRPKK